MEASPAQSWGWSGPGICFLDKILNPSLAVTRGCLQSSPSPRRPANHSSTSSPASARALPLPGRSRAIPSNTVPFLFLGSPTRFFLFWEELLGCSLRKTQQLSGNRYMWVWVSFVELNANINDEPVLSVRKMRMLSKELREVLLFVCSLEFWKMAVVWSIALITSHLQSFVRSFYTRRSNSYPHCSPVMSSSRPVCIITGATSGLGAAAAQALAKEGFTIVLVGRSSKMLSKIAAEIRKSNEEAHIKAFEVDISSFCSIFHFKESLQKWLHASNMQSSVQLLINNAGILATSPRKTAEGYDEMMATNYIGAFCLTQLLLPLLINSSVPSRIVNVTSFTHRAVRLVQADRQSVVGECFLRSKQYPFAEVYQYSKFCLLLFSYALHWQIGLSEKASCVSVIPADPGVVETNIMREVPPLLSSSAFVLLKLLGLLQSPDVGVRSIIDAALAPPETSGVYFFGGNGQTLNSSSLSYNEKLVRELWDTSYDLFKELERAYKVS